MTILQRWKNTALHNKALVGTSVLMAFGTLFYAAAAVFQIWLMQQNAKDSAAQVDRLVDATNKAISSSVAAGDASTEKALKGSRESVDAALAYNQGELRKILEQNRGALEASVTQSQASLNNTLAISQLDQRAWVGVAEFATVGGTESFEDGKRTFAYKTVQIAIRNSGKTPAVNLGAVTLQTTRDWGEKIGDYDAVVEESNRERQGASSKMLEDMIRRFPDHADEFRARDKEMRETISGADPTSFPPDKCLHLES
jgi:hypothetical protein